MADDTLTPEQALDRIRELTAAKEVGNPFEYDPWDDPEVDPTNFDEVKHAAVSRGWDRGAEAKASEIRAILALVQPAPAVTLDRDMASDLLADAEQNGGYTHAQLLDALEACTRPLGWDDLLRILDETYPEAIFPRQSIDTDWGNGPQVISLLRIIADQRSHLADRLEAGA